MRKNNILIFVFFCVFILSSIPVLGSTMSEDVNPSVSFSTPEHVQNVKRFLYNIEHPILVMGIDKGSSSDTEPALKDRFGERYDGCVFSNISQINPLDPQTLTFDFNNLDQLKTLAHEMPSTFDQIVLDDSTFKFTGWTPEHLKEFKKMLKPLGKFIFEPNASVTQIDTLRRNMSREEFEQNIKEINEFGGNRMISSYFQPLTFPIKEGDRKIEIESLMAIYKDEEINEGEKKKKLEDRWGEIFGKAHRPPQNVLSMDEVGFRRLVTKKVQLAFFDEDFLIKTILPENYQRITEEAFGRNDVQIEFNKPLPFKSNHNNTQMILITAIRKD